MRNKPKSSQLKYLLIQNLKNFIKLPVLLFTVLILKDSFSEYKNKGQKAFIEKA